MNAKLKRRTTLLLLTALLAASACVPTGGGLFCDVVRGSITFPAEVAQVVVRDARNEAVKIDTQNRYGEAKCDW